MAVVPWEGTGDAVARAEIKGLSRMNHALSES